MFLLFYHQTGILSSYPLVFIVLILLLDLYYPWCLFTALDLQPNSLNYRYHDVISTLHHVQPYYYHSVVSSFLAEWTAFFTCMICGLVNINLWSVNLASLDWHGPLRSKSFYCSIHLILYHGLIDIFFVFLPLLWYHIVILDILSPFDGLVINWSHVILTVPEKWWGFWLRRGQSIVIIPMLLLLSS